MDLGSRIRKIRIKRRKTLREIAKHTGLTAGFLSQAERNIASPSIKVLRRIAKALDTEISYFFEKSEVREISLVKRRKEGESINNNGLLIQHRCEKCGWINSYRFECIDNSLSEDSLGRKHE